MSQRITEEQKDKAIEGLKEYGTMIKAAQEAGVSTRTLNEEMLRSSKFKEAILKARGTGREKMADMAITNIRDCADGKLEMDKTRLTANLALANAYGDGFRQKKEVYVEGDIRVTTGVPRPKKEGK